MKYITYLICAVVAVLTLGAIVSAVIMALQVLVISLAVAFVVWLLVAAANFINKKQEDKPPT